MAVASNVGVIAKFAFVRFLEDNVRCIVKVGDVKRFNPKDIRNFKPEKVYMVKWSHSDTGRVDIDSGSDTSEEEVEFYKAQILRLAGTKEQLNGQLASSRVRIPKVYDTSVEVTTDDEEPARELASLLKEKKAKKKQTEKAAASLTNMLESRLKERKSSPVFQSAPARKRPFGETEVHVDTDPGQEKVKSLKRELQTSLEETDKLRKKLSDVRNELSQHRELNKRLQEALLLKIETSVKENVTALTARQPELSSEDCSSNESPGTSGVVSNLEEKNGKIHIGADVWISDEKWAAITNQKKHSMFVKNMMVAIWGSSVLQGRSLDGKACPRFKGDRAAKPALSPLKVTAMKHQFMNRLKQLDDASTLQQESSKFNKYVTEKLQDVSRSHQRTLNQLEAI